MNVDMFFLLFFFAERARVGIRLRPLSRQCCLYSMSSRGPSALVVECLTSIQKVLGSNPVISCSLSKKNTSVFIQQSLAYDGYTLASFPGPAQLSVACSTEKEPGNEARYAPCQPKCLSRWIFSYAKEKVCPVEQRNSFNSSCSHLTFVLRPRPADRRHVGPGIPWIVQVGTYKVLDSFT